MQATIGRLQLRRLSGWVARRTEIAMRVHAVLTEFPKAVRAPLPGDGVTHAFYRLYA
ncbi:DegT/DnrJ/EryC1/StrS family aminotransferase, partial [Marinobacter sp. 71-i]|nr:DegT/DnrJ/EryC1/StrS family aminotransferase [Marinobacter iranensis]